MDGQALIVLLNGPALIVLAVAAGIAVVLVLDARLRNSPRARTAARLDAMLANALGGDDATAAMLDADVFSVRKIGLRGAALRWIDRTAANIGGRKSLRVLFLLSGLAGLGAGAFAALGPGLAPARALGVCAGAGLLSFWVVQGEMRRRWMIAFLDQLVEGVELLTRSVRAGYAVPAAIRMVGKEIGAPVGEVFSQIADEDDLGVDMRQALRSAARRVDLPDFTFLAIAMVIQRETGGQLGDSLDNLHMVLRKRKEARLKVQALTAEGRMSAMIVGAIPFVAGAGVYLLNPEQTMKLFEPGLGQTMLTGAAAMLTVGLLVIRWMVKAQP